MRCYNSRFRVALFMCLSLVWLAINMPLHCWADEMRLSVAVERALAENARAIDPLSLTWKMSRTSDWKADDLAPMIGDPIMNGLYIPEEVRFKCQGGKVFAYVTHLGCVVEAGRDPNGEMMNYRTDLKMKYTYELSCDDALFYSGNGIETAKSQRQNPALHIRRLTMLAAEKADMQLINPGYVHEAGFWLPCTAQDFLDADNQPQAHILWLLAHGAVLEKVHQQTIDGVSCLVVELRGSDRLAKSIRHKVDPMNRNKCLYVFYLDPALNYSVRRREERSQTGTLGILVECDDFVQLKKGKFWLPRQCAVAYHTDWLLKRQNRFTDKPLVVERYSLTTFNQDPIPDEQFVLNYDKEAGSHIKTNALPSVEKSVSYQVPANPRELDDVIRRAIEGKSLRREPVRHSLWRWLVWINIFIASVVFLGWRLYRRYQRKRLSSNGMAGRTT